MRRPGASRHGYGGSADDSTDCRSEQYVGFRGEGGGDGAGGESGGTGDLLARQAFGGGVASMPVAKLIEIGKQMTEANVEPWLRGTLIEVGAVHRGVIHALLLAEEDVAKWCGGRRRLS